MQQFVAGSKGLSALVHPTMDAQRLERSDFPDKGGYPR